MNCPPSEGAFHPSITYHSVSGPFVRLPGTGKLIERLRSTGVGDRIDAAANQPLMVLTGAYLCSAGAILTLVWLALPSTPADVDRAGMFAMATVAVGLAVLLLALNQRLPAWSFQIFTAAGTCFVTFTIYFSGGGTSPYAFLYLWIALYALYFFTPGQAAAHVIFVALAYAAVVVEDVADRGKSDLLAALSDAAPRWTLTVGTLVVAVGFLSLLKDRLERLVARLAEAAREDPLTGLRNRRGFDEVFDLEVERAQRSNRSVSLLIGDLDHFKNVNDRLGHLKGDDVLVRAARVLENTKRRIDLVARFGGEEFAVLLPDSNEHGAYILAERLRRALAETFATDPIKLTISFGISSFPRHGASSETIISCADRALYAAKELGRDCSVIYSPELAAPLASEARQRHARGEARLASLVTLAETLDTQEHAGLVGRYASSIARALALPPESIRQVGLAGVLHDVGKSGIPSAIVSKSGALSDEEWVEMRKHPEIGARMLEGAGLPEVAKWVRSHHERPDGRGYPEGLRDREIPLGARIVAVADAYEAMTNDRIHRPALGDRAARAELEACAGTQFDPLVVDVFLRLLEGSAVEAPYSSARAT
jgi:diguanylate cyclase (GGDEF)-like protein/putative nucleotidyltransferase with HDIG domain